MKVRFSAPAEFLAELQQDPPATKIIRFTFLHRQSPMCGAIHSLTVLATYVNSQNQVVELRHFVGDDWGREFESSQATRQRGERIRELFEEKADDLGLEIRQGFYEPTEEVKQ